MLLGDMLPAAVGPSTWIIFVKIKQKKEVIRQENDTNILNLLHIHMNKPRKYKGILFVTNYRLIETHIQKKENTPKKQLSFYCLLKR